MFSLSDSNADRQIAKETGAQLAGALAAKTIQAINGLPYSTEEQRLAIARLCVHEIVTADYGETYGTLTDKYR